MEECSLPGTMRMCRFTLADRMDPMIPVSLQVRMLRDVGLEPVDVASPPPPPLILHL